MKWYGWKTEEKLSNHFDRFVYNFFYLFFSSLLNAAQIVCKWAEWLFLLILCQYTCWMVVVTSFTFCTVHLMSYRITTNGNHCHFYFLCAHPNSVSLLLGVSLEKEATSTLDSTQLNLTWIKLHQIISVHKTQNRRFRIELCFLFLFQNDYGFSVSVGI